LLPPWEALILMRSYLVTLSGGAAWLNERLRCHLIPFRLMFPLGPILTLP